MGNTSGVVNFEHNIEVKDYQYTRSLKDNRLGELKELRNTKNAQYVLAKERAVLSLEAYKKMTEECEEQGSLRHPNLLRIYGFAGEDASEIFSDTYKIYIYFEHIQDDLFRTIKRRRDFFSSPNVKNRLNLDHQYFEESELFGIMTHLIDVLEYLQQNAITHGDIRPDACFISKEGVVKILNRKLVYDTRSNYDIAKLGDHGVFLTPLSFEHLGKRKGEPVQDLYKADVFSLGMTLLECATLKKSSQCYDWNNYSINLNNLSSRLIEVKQRYSESLYEIIREMIRFEESQRPDFIVLKQYLTDKQINTSMRISGLVALTEEEYIQTSIFCMPLKPKASKITPKKPANSAQKQSTGKDIDSSGKKNFLDYDHDGIPKKLFTFNKVAEDTDEGTVQEEIETTINKVPETKVHENKALYHFRNAEPLMSPSNKIKRLIAEKESREKEPEKLLDIKLSNQKKSTRFSDSKSAASSPKRNFEKPGFDNSYIPLNLESKYSNPFTKLPSLQNNIVIKEQNIASSQNNTPRDTLNVYSYDEKPALKSNLDDLIRQALEKSSRYKDSPSRSIQFLPKETTTLFEPKYPSFSPSPIQPSTYRSYINKDTPSQNNFDNIQNYQKGSFANSVSKQGTPLKRDFQSSNHLFDSQSLFQNSKTLTTYEKIENSNPSKQTSAPDPILDLVTKSQHQSTNFDFNLLQKSQSTGLQFYDSNIYASGIDKENLRYDEWFHQALERSQKNIGVLHSKLFKENGSNF